ncbi:MAG: hypothetical protein LBC09_02000, partial [Helicobacteraceae bacterium]|nr:hypothetical protein [Helicobacteraceae bacterium]
MSAKKRELTLDEVTAKYPDFPRFVALKTDAHRRGVAYTPAALSAFDPSRHQSFGTHLFGSRDGKIDKRPEALVMRDGTLIIGLPTPIENNPYLIDAVDGRLFITDNGEPIEEVFYWEKPDYYDKRTKSGAIMQNVASARPQRLYV